MELKETFITPKTLAEADERLRDAEVKIDGLEAKVDIGKKLARAVIRYATNDNQEKWGSVYYLAERIVPLAKKLTQPKEKSED